MLILRSATKLITFLSVCLIYLNISITAFASDHTLVSEQELKSVGFSGYESINPNLLIFPIKRIAEDIRFVLLSDKESRPRYKYSLLDTRFKELVFIINFQKTGFLRETVFRYNTLLGNIILDYKDLSPDYKDELSQYIKVLQTLQDRYNSISAYRLLIQEAIDSTRRLI